MGDTQNGPGLPSEAGSGSLRGTGGQRGRAAPSAREVGERRSSVLASHSVETPFTASFALGAVRRGR